MIRSPDWTVPRHFQDPGHRTPVTLADVVEHHATFEAPPRSLLIDPVNLHFLPSKDCFCPLKNHITLHVLSSGSSSACDVTGQSINSSHIISVICYDHQKVNFLRRRGYTVMQDR